MNDVEDLDGFAIVGIAGRFPGAPNVDALWDLISAGHSGISRFSREELEDNFDAATRDDPCYVAARPILENIDQFDADFFGMLPREAELTDPQQRVLLECAWHALEDAGCDPRRYAGAIGVFAGSSLNSYFLRHVCTDRTSLERFTSEYQVGSYQELIGALHDFVATRIAYKLDLKGPAVALQSGCSTSLLAVAQACESLAFFQCDMALAGGVSITLPQHRGYMYQEGGMVSPDGTCRPFDIAAAGTVFGSGAGMVALKRLADAIVDGDRIYAVVKGFGVNNDGAGKVGFTAPSVEGQANCIASALAMADISPETIGYVECHGTATPLGDPIEISGLAKAFDKMSNSESRRESVCVLGSIKANVGHLDAAAGVTGLIKTVMMLHRAEIPRQANFVTPNPRLMLDEHAFRVNTTGELWKRGAAPRRAGVSAFGVGGTNVHLVLEEAPLREPVQVAKRQSSSVVLSLSAHDPAALQAMRVALADRLERAPGDAAPLSLEDAALTLRKGRRAFDWRLAIAASDSNQAAAHLRSASLPQRASPSLPRIVLLFPGQGSQFPGMARALYELDPGFRSDIDHGAELLAPLIGLDIRPPLLDADPGDDDTRHPIHNTVLAQPALFLVEYSLARLLIRLGVKPDAMIGHSVGEFTAATIASVMAFDEALRLIASRGRLMQEQPGGAMLSVRLSPETLTSLLPEGVVIAADNAPNLVVASGPYEAVSELERRLDAEGAAYRRLHTSHAFHSPMIDPVVPVLTNEIGSIRLAVPQMPFFSCVSGKWITAEEATSADYWALHCRAPVQFRRSVESLLQELDSPAGVVFVEVGPGRVLSTLVDAVAERGSASRCVQTLPQCQTQTETEQAFAQALGSLWASGVPVDIGGVGPLGRHKCSMPAYPFQRKRHWIDAMSSVNNAIVEGPKSDTTFVHLHPAPESLMPAVDISSAVTKSIVEQVEKLQGRAVATDEYETSFLDLGCDSLMLGQLAQAVGRIFGVNLKFRQLMRDFPDIKALASHVVAVAPTEKLPAAASDAPTLQPSTPMIAAGPSLGSMPALPFAVTGGSAIQDLMRDQLTIMQSVFAAQLAALAGSAVPVKPAPSMASAPLQATVAASPAASAIAPPASGEPPSRFQIYRGSGGATELDAGHKQFLKSFMQRYNQKTPGSKARAQASREVLADPRSASGFNAIWKEMVYPLVCDYAKGARITDVDGNSYIDLVNGYGQTMFGHAPDFVVAAVEQQLHRGFPIGPQTKLAGDVSAKISAMTGNERVAFCNTGSEAVMAAMRIARTVTGRDRVVMFSGSYHGQFDEVLVRGLAAHAAPGAMPIAPGIPVDNLSSMVVLPNDRPESLAYVRAHADSLAAVIVEPVQSRHPDLVPTEFLRELRSITEKSGTVLVFDEVVTGFRVNPGGMQKVLGIRADLATYGKVLGGGMPIGVVAGRRVLMDALDGGTWRYGDDSEPEVSPTFFAGTFVRHPLVLAAAQAVLDHIETAGPALYDGLGASCHQLAGMINADFARHGLSIKAEHYASWLYLDVSREGPLASLLFPHLRFLGVNAQEGFPLFLTTSHGAAEVDAVAKAFAESTVRLLEAGIFTSARIPSSAIPPAVSMNPAVPTSVPLTEPQQEILMAAQLGDAASMVFNESINIAFDGPFSSDAMIDALNDLVNRHEALRAHVDSINATLTIAKRLTLDIPVLDLGEAELSELIAIDARSPFDLTRGPLVRAAIVRLAETRHVLVFCAHHIICDGWSMNVLMNDMALLYRMRREGRPRTLGDAASFRDYALAQSKADLSKNAAFWRGLFATIPEVAALPGDRPRPVTKSFAGASLRTTLESELLNRLLILARQQKVTLFSLLFAGVQATFSRLAGQGDIVLTVPMAGQSLVEQQNLVGHCVNFLPIPVPIAEGESFVAHLRAVHDRLGDAMDHQDYTLGTLVRDLDLPRNPDRTPLSDIQFNLERFGAKIDFGEASAEISTNPKAFVNFDLFVNMIQRDSDILVEVDYSTDLFDTTTISRWIGHLRVLLDHVTVEPDRAITELNLLAEAEVKWLRDELNASNETVPESLLLHQMFEAQVERTPELLAARCGDESVTYRELDQRSNRLAYQIRRTVPGHDNRIALALPRSLDMLAALIAILKSGNSYVPLDPTHPSDRLRLMMEIAECAGIMTATGVTRGALPDHVQVIDIAADADAIAASKESRLADPTRPKDDDPTAHVIFTSGSTGIPKGVAIGHRAVVNLLLSVIREPGFSARDQIVAVTTVSFDIALAELFLPLVCGGVTHIADRATMSDLLALGRLMSASSASVLQATPSLWRALLDTGFKPKPGTRVISTGEPLPRDLASAIIECGADLWNMYGPTETTIWSSKARVVDANEPIVIGRPIGNTELYVLDTIGNLCPVGVAGELLIGGLGLAHGYFRRPDLTEASFIELSIAGAEPRRLYRTGDLAVRRADGSLVHLGRRDHQVKMRGFRIELEEIETVLRRHIGVADASVGVHQAGTPNAMLVATIAAEPGAEVSHDALQSFASAALPAYMVPSMWRTIASLPRTANGKLDRSALARMAVPFLAPLPTHVATPLAPPDPNLTTILEVVGSVLDRVNILPADRLFAIGANSLHIFRIAARLSERGLHIDAANLLTNPSMTDVCALLQGRKDNPEQRPPGPSLADFARAKRRKAGFS